ncbi:MAG: urease accessory UreF family protein [Alphaproteobacteria bacterium]|nr:urease accessory UreF family protein [Alphaproteobacteria bacterium]
MTHAPDWLQTVMLWTSPAFPVGAFSYSHGLEWLVETGQVTDRASLESFVLALLEFGDLQADAAFLCAAHCADGAGLSPVLEEAVSLRGASELASESVNQGRAFVKALQLEGSEYPRLSLLQNTTPDVGIPHAVAFGAACADAGVPIETAVESWLHGAVANLVSAGQRLIPLGQRDGVAALMALKPSITQFAQKARETPLAEVSSTSIVVDMAAIFHETQYTRLFRS